MHPVKNYTNKIKSQREQIFNGVHIPVLQKEVLEFLEPKPNENFIDCTIDGGGHALAILEKIKPNGKILGIDLDEKVTGHLKSKDNLILVCDNYVNLKEIVANLRLVSRREKKYQFGPVSGILFDLGMSSWHLEESGRGFTFLKDEPLDMRYSTEFSIFNFQFSNGLTAEKIVNEYPQEEIERILREYGEERFAKGLARKIVQARPIKTTFQLLKIIKSSRIYFPNRVFQALRIAVNDELNNLKKVLPQAVEILESGGRIVIISFHSLEDRIVKKFFKEEFQKGAIKILTKKPITPFQKEIKINPRSSSAKLRAAMKNA